VTSRDAPTHHPGSAWRPRDFADCDARGVVLTGEHLAGAMLHNRTAFEDDASPAGEAAPPSPLAHAGRGPAARPRRPRVSGTKVIGGRGDGSTYYTGVALPDRY